MASQSSTCSEEYPTGDQLLDKITSPLKIDRDSGLASLHRLVKGVNCDEGERKHLIKVLSASIASNLQELGNREAVANGQFSDKKVGCLSAALVLLNSSNEEDRPHNFALQIKPNVLYLMWDHDVRVRVIAGETFGMVCKLLGPSVYLESKNVILDLLESEFQRNKEMEGLVKSPETPIDPTGEVASSEPQKAISPQLGLIPASTPINPNIALTEVLKEAAVVLRGGSLSPLCPVDLGCAQLESSLKCLQFIAKGLGHQFGPLVDQPLLQLIFPSLHHQNRFVREAGFFLCAALIDSGLNVASVGKLLVREIASGLEDFCSQARIASAVACRKFVASLDQGDMEDTVVGFILPRLCLCRYYMADAKFLLYSQETWKLLFATDGRELVSKYFDNVLEYYLDATTSENHAVREAACLCLGELARKIDSKVVAPHAVGILECLRRSFHDERWHVRDAACLASGTFFLNFSEQSHGMLEVMFPLFLDNLQFPISIVRQGAAAALANIVRAYGDVVLPKVVEHISSGLVGVEQQSSETSATADLRGINPEMKYSYPPVQGEIVPYTRTSEPWELADGCLYLIGDISQIPQCQSQLEDLIPKILQCLRHRGYSQHVILMETACKVLPCLVNGVGKRQFKEHLSQFFEPVFYSIECDNSLTAGGGRVCLQELCKIYGPNIIRSRVEMYDPKLVQYVDEG